MTAIVIAKQRDRIHLATDAASYTSDSSVVCFGSKVHTLPHWPGAISVSGIAVAQPILAVELGQKFATFDDVIEGAQEALPGILEPYHLPRGATIYLVGISAKQGPVAYTFRTDDSLPATGTREDAESSEYWGSAAFELVPVGDLCVMPNPADQVVPANFTGIRRDDDLETALWSLRKILTMQRATILPEGVGSIGGWGMVTSISADRIEQRIVVRWPADTVGAPLQPMPTDWTTWHRFNPRPGERRKRHGLRLVQ
jgi:hypothetical protein